MKELAVAIELSELFERAEAEGGLVTQLFDAEIMPMVRTGLYEADSIGLGDRFNQVIEKVRLSANRAGNDRVRTLRDMLKSALATYVKNTHDAVTARGVFHRSIKGGCDIMLTCAAAAILANALSGSHSKEAQSLMQKIAAKLTGPQKLPMAAMENASGAAAGAGSIAVMPYGKKRKRRKDSIFAEGRQISFSKPNSQGHTKRMGGIMINEDVTPLPGAAKEPVQNPALAQADNLSNVQSLRPERKLFHDEPQTDKFWIDLFLPDGERAMRGTFEDVVELALHYGMTGFDKRNALFYAPSDTTGTVPTMMLRGPAQEPLNPFQLAFIANRIAQSHQAQMESLSWGDLMGEPSAMQVLREVAETGTERHHAGILLDPTTAELVLSAHRCMTPENQQRYEAKPLAKMIAIAERAVQRGVISVSLEEV